MIPIYFIILGLMFVFGIGVAIGHVALDEERAKNVCAFCIYVPILLAIGSGIFWALTALLN